MHKIPAAAVPVVVAETRELLAATDRALLAHAQMFAAMIEGVNGSDLPMNVTSDLYAAMASHGAQLAASRNALRDVVSRLTKIKDISEYREVALGCPMGAPEIAPVTEPFFTGAQLNPQRERA